MAILVGVLVFLALLLAALAAAWPQSYVNRRTRALQRHIDGRNR